MKRSFRWFLMINKRLYRKLPFVVMLALIPISILAFNIIANEDSGFLNIVLAEEDQGDSISSEIIEKLTDENSIIRFTTAASPEDAVNFVRTGEADAAWIFPADMQKKINSFADTKDSVVKVIEREQTVFLRLSREKLSSALYKYCAKAYYIDFARNNLPQLDALSDSELLEYYNSVKINEEMFIFDSPADPDGKDDMQKSEGYLSSPIRGLLGIVVVLCGIAAAMFHIRDESPGTFSHIPENKRVYVAFACIWIAILNVTAVALISLGVSGLGTSLLNEILCALLYSLCCTVFCLALKQIFSGIKLLGALTPLFIIVMIVVCPVFFDFRSIGAISHLFPPTYYVNAAYDSKYLAYMSVYAAAGALLCFMLDKLFKRKRS